MVSGCRSASGCRLPLTYVGVDGFGFGAADQQLVPVGALERDAHASVRAVVDHHELLRLGTHAWPWSASAFSNVVSSTTNSLPSMPSFGHVRLSLVMRRT